MQHSNLHLLFVHPYLQFLYGVQYSSILTAPEQGEHTFLYLQFLCSVHIHSSLLKTPIATSLLLMNLTYNSGHLQDLLYNQV